MGAAGGEGGIGGRFGEGEELLSDGAVADGALRPPERAVLRRGEAVAEGPDDIRIAGALGGRCGELAAGESAIFLSASVESHEGETYDLAFGPGELVTGPAEANWWTLADFLAPPP